MKTNNQKGVSLLLTLLVMIALLAIALGVSQLSLGEIKITRDVPSSIIAYYAAEAGIEQAIYEKRINSNNLDISDCSISLDNGSQYGVTVDDSGGTITISSIGCYRGVTRAIEVNF